ncbi:ectoine hydroxylase [Pseudonocardia sediminis]|uniref:Ectoine hydroxylase n=1 Tax=Pseudonocardia sediminis TaxID=1397368 RepID=A0A4Q7V0Q9_PSEST|nr:ectoine hydroxylase [Pseudonocardia sediminis]RZT86891.1 ectoine hydroxylase [Pseudonocardia sediminis]
MTRSGTSDLYPTRGAGAAATLIPREHPTVWPSAYTGPASDGDLVMHDCNGYLKLPDLLTAGEVADHWDELGRLCTDPRVRADERTIVEPGSEDVRSIFEVHRLSDAVAELARDPRVAGRARQVLGSEVYLHQSRINYMPGFDGKGFYWHSDFETWHAEDGMPTPRAVSISIALTDNHAYNGGLMVLPSSHRVFASCAGETPDGHHEESLRSQQVGTPDRDTLRALTHRHGIDQFTGPAGSALMFDSNLVHGSGNNITPHPRSNIFLVFNSVENPLDEPYAAGRPRPEWVASRDATPLR